MKGFKIRRNFFNPKALLKYAPKKDSIFNIFQNEYFQTKIEFFYSGSVFVES